MMSMNAQERSTPKDASFLSRTNEGDLCLFSGDLPLDRIETGSPSSGKGFASFCGPRVHEARQSVPRAGDAPEMIGVFDHQFDWLVPQIVAHVVTSRVIVVDDKIRSLPTRSGYRTEVRGAYATKGRWVRL
jgi:hypothetical protein